VTPLVECRLLLPHHEQLAAVNPIILAVHWCLGVLPTCPPFRIEFVGNGARRNWFGVGVRQHLHYATVRPRRLVVVVIEVVIIIIVRIRLDQPFHGTGS
jgi:hypothetical protein